MALRKRRSIAPSTAVTDAPGGRIVALSGDWTSSRAVECEEEAARIGEALRGARAITLDLKAVSKLDTLGTWVLSRLIGQLREEGGSARIINATDAQKVLLEEIIYKPLPEKPVKREAVTVDLLSDIGLTMVNFWKDLVHGIAFLGAFVNALANILRGRSRFRMASLVSQLERVGLRSVPIIVLISILVGGIISQQSIFQLRQFGTVHFVADLLGVLVLRELAVLITSIMLAGRTGSSFTAELGSMKMREEVDALRTMGLDPMEVLVVPRVLALLIGLPLLTFISSMAMLFGGGVVALLYGGVTPEVFMFRLQNGIWFSTFAVGLIKAPFMALVIGIIACIEGFEVQGSAESLGARTTSSVVKAIFMVIVVDGLFAMFFAAIQY
jgi:phospholipid/cholesterol/gamma-HCH transport system permease protein